MGRYRKIESISVEGSWTIHSRSDSQCMMCWVVEISSDVKANHPNSFKSATKTIVVSKQNILATSISARPLSVPEVFDFQKSPFCWGDPTGAPTDRGLTKSATPVSFQTEPLGPSLGCQLSIYRSLMVFNSWFCIFLEGFKIQKKTCY